MTTVGYGDVIPQTPLGKSKFNFLLPINFVSVIAILCALSGIVAFALPVPGIIARFQDEQEQVSLDSWSILPTRPGNPGQENAAGQKKIGEGDDITEEDMVRKKLRKMFLTPMKNT